MADQRHAPFVDEAENYDISIHQLANSLYRVLLGREPDDEGYRNFVNQYKSNPENIDQLIRDIILSTEFKKIALRHKRIAEAALELALPLITGHEPTKDVIDLLAERLVKNQKACSSL